ncbi:Hypothetical predicted protein [Pelobates cultripes]|uniref:Uncharacterized protein n=1 Tax=Pelobates cultripes TaxID=61616 RepID=A0AAD1VWW9_PELCU|nr:Hypothetical predicted protein [Pelobates cultripes]
MGRTKRHDTHQTPRGNQGYSQAGPMDRFLQTLASPSCKKVGPNMANTLVPSPTSDTSPLSLADISANIRALSSKMVTKSDLKPFSDTIHEAVCSEVAML